MTSLLVSEWPWVVRSLKKKLAMLHAGAKWVWIDFEKFSRLQICPQKTFSELSAIIWYQSAGISILALIEGQIYQPDFASKDPHSNLFGGLAVFF